MGKRSLFFLYFTVFFLFCLPLEAQIKDVGLPFIVNHERTLYNAGSQNWSIAQSDGGFMYFGNNDGVLEYNGSEWTLYPMPNTSVVRSVMAMGDTIYAGAFEEIGFLAPDSSGRLVWHSLTHLVPSEFRNFDEVWRIYADDGRIVFQSFECILIYEHGSFTAIRPEGTFGFLHQIGSDMYVVEERKGLFRLQGDTMSLVSEDDVFSRNEISFVLSHLQENLLIGTSNEGIYVWDGSELTRWNVAVNSFLLRDNLYSGLRLTDGSYVFGSVSDGIFIADKGGNVLQHINRSKGLQNNTALSLFQDRNQNLWLGMDNGIDYIEISSPVTVFNHHYNIESVYAIHVHEDILYVGTNQGLFAAPMHNLVNQPHVQPAFRLIEGTKGQVWSLAVVDGTLLCGHNNGAFQIEGFSARQISDIRGFWSFLKIDYDVLVAGAYSGLVRLQRDGDEWKFLDRVQGFRESSRELFLVNDRELWISHGYRGLFRLMMNDDFSRVLNVQLYHNEANLPEELPYNIQKVNGQMRISTHDGFFLHVPHTDVFLPDAQMNALFQDKGFIDKIVQDESGNIWYFTTHYLGVLRLLEDGTYRDITSPFSRVSAYLLPAFQNLFRQDSRNVYIGSQTGLIHYNSAIINEYHKTEEVYFTEVAFYGKDASDTHYLYSEVIQNNEKYPPGQPHAMNSVRFRFTTPIFENPDAALFSYRLSGFETEWSAWSTRNFKEYTNLREGQYVFEVKALNAFGVESTVSTFRFVVKPPFLRSRFAYVIYALLLIVLIAGNAYYVRRRVLRIRQREKIRHEKRLARREEIFQAQTALSEKEIMQLRNEGLKSEMQHKNKELANATMHLIQKNKTLTDLKDDLSRVIKKLPADHPEQHNIKGLIKKINKDLKNEKGWELFNNYFDEVHQDFLNRLKEKHDNLMPKDLRLCAYLRMNLSTKEIAPLMNISVRGVEISRYRLRKKLQLDKEVNLTDYILMQ